MIDVKNRRILGVSYAVQLAALMTFYLIQHSIGYGFCLEHRQCIVESTKFLLINLFISVIAGWICSGAFVIENGNNPGPKNTRKKVNSFIKAICVTFCGSFVYHFITILYGAPFIQNMEETYLFSCSMALMTLFNLTLVSDGNWWSIIQILDLQLYKTGKTVDNARLISFLAIVGALIGSAAIPLDWDRPWQAWPVPCSFGATIGYTMGLMIFMFLPLAEYIKSRHEQSKMKYY